MHRLWAETELGRGVKMKKIKKVKIDLSFLRVICLIMIGMKLSMGWLYYALAVLSILTIHYER